MVSSKMNGFRARCYCCLVPAMCWSVNAFALDRERSVPLVDVPKTVIDSATAQIEGINIVDADIVLRESGETIYELEGTNNGKTYELHITPAGTVIRTILEVDDGEPETDAE